MDETILAFVKAISLASNPSFGHTPRVAGSSLIYVLWPQLLACHSRPAFEGAKDIIDSPKIVKFYTKVLIPP
jgi:hypothetical protein